MQNQLWSKKLGKVSRGGPPRSAFFVSSGNLHVGGCRRFGRRSRNFHAPVAARGAGRRWFERKNAPASLACQGLSCIMQTSEQRTLCLELVGNRAHGGCEWVSECRQVKAGRECGGGVLSLDTIAADPPVLIRHAGFLGEQAHSHTHTHSHVRRLREAYCCCFCLPVLRVSHLAKSKAHRFLLRWGIYLWLIAARCWHVATCYDLLYQRRRLLILEIGSFEWLNIWEISCLPAETEVLALFLVGAEVYFWWFSRHDSWHHHWEMKARWMIFSQFVWVGFI
jgi:hypothetical protein